MIEQAPMHRTQEVDPPVDLGSARSIQDPTGYFRAARERGGAVQWSGAHRAWVVLSHAEVEAAFRDTETLSADRSESFRRAAARHSPAFGVVAELLAGWMNFRDDPAHARLREPVRAAFTPRAVGALEEDIRRTVEQAIEAFPGEVVDLHQAFARPIPALVIADLLGADREDRERFQDWSDDIGKIVFSVAPGSVAEEPVVRAAEHFVAFFARLIERERAKPSGNLLSAIVHAGAGELSPIELVGACTLLLFGGHETTTTLLGNALGILLGRPDLAEWLRGHPEAYGSAVEEFMRVAGPARTMARKVRVSHARGGGDLEPGQTVFLGIAAANHDEAVFDEPSRIDLARDPNPQLGFGWGPHFCLGANLARLEARVALRILLERFPHLEPALPVPPLEGGIMGFARRPLLARLNG
jgi:cytochrome P450